LVAPQARSIYEDFERPGSRWVTGPTAYRGHEVDVRLEESRLVHHIQRFGGTVDHAIIPYALPVRPVDNFRLNIRVAFTSSSPADSVGFSMLIREQSNGDRLVIRFSETGHFAVYLWQAGQQTIISERQPLIGVKFKATHYNDFEIDVEGNELLIFVNRELQDRISVPQITAAGAISLGIDGLINGQARIDIDEIALTISD
jgi:hypothetical protein